MHLWSAGNVRLPTGRDLTVPPQEALELIDAMSSDVRASLLPRQPPVVRGVRGLVGGLGSKEGGAKGRKLGGG